MLYLEIRTFPEPAPRERVLGKTPESYPLREIPVKRRWRFLGSEPETMTEVTYDV